MEQQTDMIDRISRPAFDLITRFETGGKAYYDRFLKRPSWPGGASGVTIGFGYDMGYESALQQDWGKHLDREALRALERTRGKTGQRARQAISGVRFIEVPWEAAEEVFNERTLPQEIKKTLKAFPGSADKLSANAFGALVSLVFNRGTAMDGDRRREMRNIKGAIIAGRPDLTAYIASQFREMKRLWPNNEESDNDLNDRREAEAKLVLTPDLKTV